MLLLRRGHPVRSKNANLEIEMMFDLESDQRHRRQACSAPWRPPLEVFETDQRLVIRAEIGGLTADQIHVDVTGDELRIRGERSVPGRLNSRTYHESRVRYGPFDATIRVPFPVDVSTAIAEYVDGFLTINLPRLTPITIAPQEQKEHAETW
jgi:HSP20 family protein